MMNRGITRRIIAEHIEGSNTPPMFTVKVFEQWPDTPAPGKMIWNYTSTERDLPRILRETQRKYRVQKEFVERVG